MTNETLDALAAAMARMEEAAEAARAALAAQPLDEQVAAVRAELEPLKSTFQRLAARAAALPDSFIGKAPLVQLAESAIAMSAAQGQWLKIAQSAGPPAAAPKA